ncbi:hypothetical protein GCM10010282_32460 [Streptomyces roseolus]|nr:hypothetical protein GCM10010282_32460 [Streptomyces roseolus]
MTGTKAVRASLPPDAVRRKAFAEASRFRGEFYGCLTTWRDALFGWADAALCADGVVKSPVDLSPLPERRRGHGAMYSGLHHGRIDTGRPRTAPAGPPLPRFDGGRLVLTVDGPSWLRSDAPCPAERLFCRVHGRTKTASQFVPDRPYSFVAVLEPGAASWTAVLDAVRLGPADDATAVTAAQLRGVVHIGFGLGHAVRRVEQLQVQSPHSAIAEASSVQTWRNEGAAGRTARAGDRSFPADPSSRKVWGRVF